ncbi:leucine-rich repeat-containing protein 29 isoform X2 [Heterocephalus glaber]|uniref:Leucine-rich repeat-containing protein 29 isoform X2 n=1 Tax=Heterocephalus glaber TaxID=10181 RepID=A0AAX6SXQ9_HETGA|nr:leucine-rich repeat-containing protein 29 isoform X2 [Heterocephalus glaber]
MAESLPLELHPILGSSSALLKSERGTRTLDPQPHLKGICLLSLGRTTIQSRVWKAWVPFCLVQNPHLRMSSTLPGRILLIRLCRSPFCLSLLLFSFLFRAVLWDVSRKQWDFLQLPTRTIQAICTYLTHLSVLRLGSCKALQDWGLLGLREPSEEPALGPQLYSEQEHQASDPEEPFLKPQGPSLLMLQALQELDLTACSKLTDASLAKVLQFPQLRQLSLSLLPALTDNGLVAVARGCPSLEHLSLSHCSCLSDDDWAQAAGSWLRLQHLNLSSCSQLTEQTLDTNSQVCKQLQVLDVAMCPGINVVAVRHFQAQLPQVTCEGLT